MGRAVAGTFGVEVNGLLLRFLTRALMFLYALGSTQTMATYPLRTLFGYLCYFFIKVGYCFRLLAPRFLQHLPLVSSLSCAVCHGPGVIGRTDTSRPIHMSDLCGRDCSSQSLLYTGVPLYVTDTSLSIHMSDLV